MRIETIHLSWFRGAGESIALEPGGGSIVIYGENGAGKSSFIDAVEYAICSGKIGHLSHEQSGKRQEKGIPNTHTPAGKVPSFSILFKGNSTIETQIKKDGTSKISNKNSIPIETWDYRRTILRQDEVARFIQNTKGEKYSALLPLLGLQHMENAAENLRRLRRAIETESDVKRIKGSIEQLLALQKQTFGSTDITAVNQKIEELYKHYHGALEPNKEAALRCKELKTTLDDKIKSSSADQKEHLILKRIGDLVLSSKIEEIRATSSELASAAESLVTEKLQVLAAATAFSEKLTEEKIKCPACGQETSKDQFQSHVNSERERLQSIINTFQTKKRVVAELCDDVKSIKTAVTQNEIKTWRERLISESATSSFDYLDHLDLEKLRAEIQESDLKEIEDRVVTLIVLAKTAAEKAPPDVQQLTNDQRVTDIAIQVFESKSKAEFVAQIAILDALLVATEEKVRDEIAIQSDAAIKAISGDIQGMWSILHPNEHVEDVRLHVPKDSDKAIDICLKFHGVEQDSPRLTLSEGFRNSLGLCIFLAMAKRELANDRPIFLDDVVVSIDRNHRGMIVDLLEQQFDDRQLIIMTHDRDWFVELKQQLDGSKWKFKALMPYENPPVGIRWSESNFGFDDARKLLDTDPSLAGSVARKIMDIELALRIQRLGIRLPYLHRERNDHRVAHEFLDQMISDADTCFEKKGTDGSYIKNVDAIELLRDADKLLVSWGNKAVHATVTKSEAIKLIESCELALKTLDCDQCKKFIAKLEDAKAKVLRCECGHIRWRYGKAQ